jgi:ssDNA-binding Zn-finger/Zn-ribbon topoisomerase 1
LEGAFVKEGGFGERLAAARIAERERTREQDQTPDPAKPALPDCPLCGKPMVLRTARKGKTPGVQFWGCSAFPACKGAHPAEAPKNPTDPSDPTDRSDEKR